MVEVVSYAQELSEVGDCLGAWDVEERSDAGRWHGESLCWDLFVKLMRCTGPIIYMYDLDVYAAV